MVSLKDYAKESGVTYEAVRQQVKRYSADLEGHIHQQGRTQYLDDAGVAILDSHRAQRPMVIYEADYDRELRQKEQEVKILNEELKEAYKEQAQLLRQIGELQGAQARLEAAETAQKALIEARDDFKALAEKKDEEAARAWQEANMLRNELDEIKSMPFWKRLFWKGE